MSLKLFSGDGSGMVSFPYPQSELILKASGGVSISLDGGSTYMDVADGSYNWKVGLIKEVYFGPGGSWEVFAPRDSFSTGVLVFNPSKISGLTGWWDALSVDGQENSTLSDGDRVDTWHDLSGKGVDLRSAGGIRPHFRTADTSGDTPTYPVVDFNETGNEEHFISSFAAGVDFEDVLPSEGKSFYAVLHFDGLAGSYSDGSNRGFVPRVFGDFAYPSKLSLEYTRYSRGGKDWNLVLVQDHVIRDTVQVGSLAGAYPNNNGKYIISFRHDGENLWLSTKNAAFGNDSSLTKLEATPDAVWFALRFAYINHDMEYFEVAAFNRALSDAEDQAMLEYLNEKWGVGASGLDEYLPLVTLPVTSGLTGQWRSDNIDGVDNTTYIDTLDESVVPNEPTQIDTWVDLSGNGYDLEITGGERPFYWARSWSFPTVEVVSFETLGSDEHRIGSYPGEDFELFLPSNGKSVYACLEFRGLANVWSLGNGRNIVSDGGQSLAKWGIEYARYSDGGNNYDIVFHQNGAYVGSTVIGNTGSDLPNQKGRYIISFRQDANNPGTDNYFIEVYNADPSVTTSSSGECADSPDMAWFNVLRCFSDRPTVELMELLTFSRALTDEENAEVVQYLNLAWSVGL